MKKLLLPFFWFLTSLQTYSQGSEMCDGKKVIFISTFNNCDTNPWALVFEDNFDGNSLDLNKWKPVTGVPRDTGFGKQKAWHKPENIFVSGGTLKIISKREKLNNMTFVSSWNPYTIKTANFDFSTGEISTIPKFLYGKFEARIKIPKGKGFWPAFWTFGDPGQNEIDIFEFSNENDWQGNFDPSKLSKVHRMSVHYDYERGSDPKECARGEYTGPDFSSDFHIFSAIWNKNTIEWYVDGVLKRIDYKYFTILGQPEGCTVTAWHEYLENKIYPQDPMSIILNIAIQSNSQAPDESTPFPSQMEVDWVRCYQRKPCINVSSCYITGPDNLCLNSTGTYTLNNIPNNAEINWTSNGLALLSGQGSSSISVKAVEVTNCWLKASISNSCSTIPQFSVIVGPPSITSIDGPSNVKTGLGYSFYGNANTQNGTTYTWWTSPGTNTRVFPYSGSNMANIYFDAPGGYTVYVKAANACGQNSAPLGKFVMASMTTMKLIPNPASENVTITMSDIQPSIISDQAKLTDIIRSDTQNAIPVTYTVRVLNSQSALLFTATRTGKSFTIPVNNLINGVYVVEVSDGKNKFRQQLVINH